MGMGMGGGKGGSGGAGKGGSGGECGGCSSPLGGGKGKGGCISPPGSGGGDWVVVWWQWWVREGGDRFGAAVSRARRERAAEDLELRREEGAAPLVMEEEWTAGMEEEWRLGAEAGAWDPLWEEWFNREAPEDEDGIWGLVEEAGEDWQTWRGCWQGWRGRGRRMSGLRCGTGCGSG